jgi:hypothetical protein
MLDQRIRLTFKKQRSSAFFGGFIIFDFLGALGDLGGSIIVLDFLGVLASWRLGG